MHTFQDKNGKKWNFELTFGTARRVKAECGIDLVNVMSAEDGGKSSPLVRLAEDPFLLIDVLFSICKSQAKEAGMDDFAFADCFDGAAIDLASDALMEEIINFSQPAKRKMLTRIYSTAKTFAGEMNAKLDKLMDNPEFDAEIESALKKSFSDMPESSESIQSATPSGN